MLIYLLLELIVSVLFIIFYLLPDAALADIPLIGNSVSSILLTVVRYWNTFMETFPYAQTGWDIFIYVIIPFEIALLTLKLFLGSRTPVSH